MSQELYVVTGATGNVGRELTRILVSKGKKVRAVARGLEKLKALPGAEPFAASLEDPSAMGKAFTGATAVFAMIPSKYDEPDFRAYQNKVSYAIASGIASSGVRRVVHLSSMGAQSPNGGGPINGLYDSENRLNALSADVLHLRPAFFMENNLGSIGMIKGQGFNGGGMKADIAIPMVATRDIAAAAAEGMLGGEKGKVVRELLGPREYSMLQATAILGKAIGKPDLKYVEFPMAGVKPALKGMGMSDSAADLFVEMINGFNNRTIVPVEKRGPRNTTPTTLEEFAPVFAQVFGKS
jgi:uncharacterized protein YbjT (DUF2867 family)